MKSQNRILNGILTSSMILLFPATVQVWGTQNQPDRPAVKFEAIPMDQIGVVAGKQYFGDGLTVAATAEGAHLRCVFQRLEGEVTSEGLWLTSTVTNTIEDRFQVKAAAVRRGPAGQLLNNLISTSNIQLEATGSITVDGQRVRFTRPGLVEEYSLSMDGVRQDFVLKQRLGGTGELQVRLDVVGARAEKTAYGAQLVLEKSGRRIAYSRLHVTDANGRELQARIEVVPAGDRLTGLNQPKTGDVTINRRLLASSSTARELAVMVNDANAVYPVRIDPTFSDANWISLNPSIPGANGSVYATVVDSSGNLYIGGSFNMVGDTNVNYIAKWNGNRWSPLGAGLNNTVYALAVSGGNVYAGGNFTMAGGNAANYMAKWNGSSWSVLGSGLNNTVRALAVSGSDVYAGGLFTTAGGASANYIAKWNGSSWSSLGSGIVGYYASSTFLVGKVAEIVFPGGAYDTGKDVSTDLGAGRSLAGGAYGLP